MYKEKNIRKFRNFEGNLKVMRALRIFIFFGLLINNFVKETKTTKNAKSMLKSCNSSISFCGGINFSNFFFCGIKFKKGRIQK